MNNLLRSIVNLWQKKSLIGDAQKQLQVQIDENEKLKDQLSRVSKPGFVEEEARDKLFMVKPGEQVVLLGASQEASSSVGKASSPASIAPWQQWWKLFFASE